MPGEDQPIPDPGGPWAGISHAAADWHQWRGRTDTRLDTHERAVTDLKGEVHTIGATVQTINENVTKLVTRADDATQNEMVKQAALEARRNRRTAVRIAIYSAVIAAVFGSGAAITSLLH